MLLGVQHPREYQNSILHVDSTVILRCRNWNVDAKAIDSLNILRGKPVENTPGQSNCFQY